MCTQMHNVSGGHLVISVIVPVYNVERWLDRCVTSIVGQTYKNLEIGSARKVAHFGSWPSMER